MMKASLARAMSVAVAGMVAGTMFMTANARISAHPASKSLPVLKMDYFTSASGKLAKSLDPALITAATSADTVAMVDANLVNIHPNNKVYPDLASKYTVSKDHKTYTFTIRSNARFSNGHFVTAADEKFSIERALAPSTRSPVATTYLAAIKGATEYADGKATDVTGIKVLSKRVLQIRITKPYAFFLKTLTYPTADALDPTVVKGKIAASTNNFLTNTCSGNVGAGPFKFVCQNGDSNLNSFYPSGGSASYTMVPNPYYYGHKAKIKVVIPAYDTIDTAYKTYLAGAIDMTRIPTAFISKWVHNKTQYHQFATSRVFYITPNSKMAPFNDAHCRLAVAYGIDRNTIAKKVLHGSSNPIYDVVPPGFLGYYNGKNNPHFNLAKAKQELAKCSTRSTHVDLKYPTGSSDNDNEFSAIQSMLTNVGFNISVKPITLNDWYTVVSESLDKTQTQMVHNGWQQDYPDPQDYVTLLNRTGEDYNIGGFHNAKFDSLVDRADIEANAKKRAQLYIQAQHLLLNSGGWISMINPIGRELIKPYVHGLVGTVSYADQVPVDYDWSKVTVKH